MTKTFDDYVLDWFYSYLRDNEDSSEDFYLTVFNSIVDRSDGDSLDEWLDEGETVADYLFSEVSGGQVWEKLFGKDAGLSINLPDKELFLIDMFTSCASDNGDNHWDFSNEFIENMAYSSSGYEDPSGFFKDIAYGGCQSGMVGMLIYTSDCLKIYGRYADSMEEFIDMIEEEMGEPMRNTTGCKRYVWACWLCYEELAHRIGCNLFPNEI